MSATISFPERGTPTTYSHRTGVSPTSKRLLRIIEETANHKRESFLGQQYNNVFEALYEVFQSRREDNWDGDGATGISEAGYYEAVRLVELLPAQTSIPEIIAEPDGSIGLEWYNDAYHVFVVTVKGNGRLYYAGLFGLGVEANGSEDLTESLPKEIPYYIQRIKSRNR